MTGSGGFASNIAKAMSVDAAPMTDIGPSFRAALLRTWEWLTRQSRGVLARSASRRLKVAETLSLGEKSFVSILHVDGEQFLVGGSPSRIVLLAKLEAKSEGVGAGSFQGVLSRAEVGVGGCEAEKKSSVEVTR